MMKLMFEGLYEEDNNRESSSTHQNIHQVTCSTIQSCFLIDIVIVTTV